MTDGMSRTTSKIEALAAANLKPASVDVSAEWDALVSARMQRDNCDRSVAVDRLLATRDGSDLWLRCCGFDARQPKVLADGTKSGNWLNGGDGVVRRVPRKP
jgi:hypothetical protein